jgi:hypothetical protein
MAEGSCEEIRDLWGTRRESTPPPMIRVLLEAQCLTARIFSRLQSQLCRCGILDVGVQAHFELIVAMMPRI